MAGYPFKRLFDIVGSMVLLLVTLPFFFLAFILTLMNGTSPFFSQKRLTLNCKEFTIYKFTSMKAPAKNAAPIEIMPNSSEISWIGRLLRNTCIDELPQLLNVLKGDMSLIGPRPHALNYAEHYAQIEPRYYERYAVRPGLVCMVQVTPLRYLTESAEHLKARIASDLDYINQLSFRNDVKILFKAVYYVLTFGSYKAITPEPETKPAAAMA